MSNNRDDRRYVGIFNDHEGGMTDSGKIIRDAWVFGLIPETETCEGWMVQGIQTLWEKIDLEWEKYGFLVNNLPPELRERFDRIQSDALVRAKKLGWDPNHALDNEA
jgi:hypothetical protein